MHSQFSSLIDLVIILSLSYIYDIFVKFGHLFLQTHSSSNFFFNVDRYEEN